MLSTVFDVLRIRQLFLKQCVLFCAFSGPLVICGKFGVVQFTSGFELWGFHSRSNSKVSYAARQWLRMVGKKYPYTSEFSRSIIFAVFADFSNSRKLCSRKFIIPYTRNSTCENCFREMFGNTCSNLRKLWASKIWTYTVTSHSLWWDWKTSNVKKYGQKQIMAGGSGACIDAHLVSCTFDIRIPPCYKCMLLCVCMHVCMYMYVYTVLGIYCAAYMVYCIRLKGTFIFCCKFQSLV